MEMRDRYEHAIHTMRTILESWNGNNYDTIAKGIQFELISVKQYEMFKEEEENKNGK